ncbi:helix-turn-helix domain-containing protein [Streptomyces prunicolor]|uniref:helix-turn-helix domain-containing protein n=1 Tax=Streptomyces prunicolor TaxID=67348 RepID=UPI0038683377|nr:helix-turn-helix domain-containing protein [Streptomyces prunicolor]
MVNPEKFPFLAGEHSYGSYLHMPISHMEMNSTSADGLEVTTVDCGPAAIRFENCSSDPIASPQCVIFYMLSGTAFTVHEGRCTEIDAGTLIVTDDCADFSFDAPGVSRLLILRFVGEMMDRMPAAHRGSFRVVRRTEESQAGSLLFPLLRTLATEIWNSDGELGPGLEHIVSFLGMFMARIAYAEVGDYHPVGSVPLLTDVKESIERQLGLFGVDPATLAAEHHISVRQLHRLFEPTGESVMHYIKRRRLEGFAHDLVDPDLRHKKISELAAAWGMPDSAMLSKNFRSAYGVPPREYRKKHCPE